MYKTDGRVASASEYGREVYANALDYFCQINVMLRNDFTYKRYVYEVPLLML